MAVPELRTLGWCACGHLEVAHIPHGCRGCNCRVYRESARVPVQDVARVLTMPDELREDEVGCDRPGERLEAVCLYCDEPLVFVPAQGWIHSRDGRYVRTRRELRDGCDVELDDHVATARRS